jgi:RNA polymerase sigma-B factor
LTQALHRIPTTNEIAQHIGVSDEDVLEAMEANSLYRLTSIDAGRPDGESTTSDWRIGIEDRELAGADDRVNLTRLLSVLGERERRIVYLRFFDGLSQSEIAEMVGISQMHVSRLLTKSLEALSSHAGALEGNG